MAFLLQHLTLALFGLAALWAGNEEFDHLGRKLYLFVGGFLFATMGLFGALSSQTIDLTRAVLVPLLR